MNKEFYKNHRDISFKDYYQNLKEGPKKLRDEICKKLQISHETFYVKYRTGTFSYPQQVVISQIIGQPIEVLFPKTEKVA